MNNITPSQNRRPEPMPKPDQRPACWANDPMAKQWTTWINTGMGYTTVEHRRDIYGRHTTSTCSMAMCAVQDDAGNTRMCPPRWYTRMVEKDNK